MFPLKRKQVPLDSDASDETEDRDLEPRRPRRLCRSTNTYVSAYPAVSDSSSGEEWSVASLLPSNMEPQWVGRHGTGCRPRSGFIVERFPIDVVDVSSGDSIQVIESDSVPSPLVLEVEDSATSTIALSPPPPHGGI